MASTASNYYNLKDNQKKLINNFLSKELYYKELYFKRSRAEVVCITYCVKSIVKQLMTDVCREEPLFEISHQYLVGSMAEGTRLFEPDEFDFLVVLKHFSQPGAISIHNEWNGEAYYVRNENIGTALYSRGTSDYVSFNHRRQVEFLNCFMSHLLKNIIASMPHPYCVETRQGKLTINSTTVCHHGPASVVKLRWEPKSKSSSPLDILIDITPCIEQKGIDKLKGSNYIPDGYKSRIFNDDTFMLIHPFNNGIYDFIASITTTEVKIVNTLSSHHKTCYMILKYCFNSIIGSSQYDPYRYDTPLPSYIIKMFVLRHVLMCESPEKGHHDTEECLVTCLLDIMGDLKDSVSKDYVYGIFGTVQMPFATTQYIDNVIGLLIQIGKGGYSVERHEDFRKAYVIEHLYITPYKNGQIDWQVKTSNVSYP